MINNILPYALMIGVNTALETLVSQAYGRKNLQDCGLYLHRAWFLILCLFFPIAISFCGVEWFLTKVGIEADTSYHARTYIVILLPSILINSLGDSVDLFLISMGFNKTVCLLQLIVIPIHLLSCWLLVVYLE